MTSPGRRRTGLVIGLARRAAVVAALVALVLGLGNREAPAPQRLPELSVLVAVDVTTSMSALDDPSGSRITAVRRDLVELVRGLDQVRLSVITFGRSRAVRLPSTPDRTAYEEVVASLQVERPEAGSGSSVGRAVRGILVELERAEAAPGDPIPVLVLVTDGENTVPDEQPSFEEVGGSVGAAVILGYGTAEGGLMPLERVEVDAKPPTAAQVGRAVLTDRETGEPALSRRDDENLQDIAAELDAPYVAADGTHDLAQVAADLEATAYADLEPAEPERELRWLWALLLLLLVLADLRRGWRGWLEARREVRA